MRWQDENASSRAFVAPHPRTTVRTTVIRLRGAQRVVAEVRRAAEGDFGRSPSDQAHGRTYPPYKKKPKRKLLAMARWDRRRHRPSR